MVTIRRSQTVEQQRTQRKGDTRPPAVFLWNPTMAVLLSLFFTPVFGSLVQMLNWRTLEEPNLEKQSQWWCLAGVGILLGSHVFSALYPEARVVDTFSVSLLVLYGCGWLLLAARTQALYVRKRFPKGYGRKPWHLVLLMALAACVSYVLLGFALSYLADLFR